MRELKFVTMVTHVLGMVEDVQFNDQHVANEYWGVKGRVGIVPLINQRAYWFITVHAKEGDPKYQSFENPIFKHILITFQMK